MRASRTMTRCSMRSGISSVGKVAIHDLFVRRGFAVVQFLQRFLVGFGLTSASTDRGNVFVPRRSLSLRNRDVARAVRLAEYLSSCQVIACPGTKIAHGESASLRCRSIMSAAFGS